MITIKDDKGKYFAKWLLDKKIIMIPTRYEEVK